MVRDCPEQLQCRLQRSRLTLERFERVVPTSHFDTTTRGCSYLQCSRSNKDLVVALVFEKANNCSYYLYLLYLCSTWHCPPPGFPDSWAFKQSVRTTSGCGPGPTAARQHSPRCPGCVPHTRCTRCSLTGRSCSLYSLEMWLIHWFIWYYFLLLIFFFFFKLSFYLNVFMCILAGANCLRGCQGSY